MSIAAKALPRRTIGALRAALATARIRAQPGLAWLREFLPIVGKRAVRRRRRIVLAPYKRTHSISKTILSIVAPPMLAVFCLIYGFFYALTAPTLIVAFVVPVLVLAALIIWALPHQRTAPTLGIEFLYPAFFVAMILWPNYLAVALPGLPWITMLRIIGLPMAGLLLVCLSVSPQFQRRVSESVKSIRLLWFCLCAFVAVQLLTIFISASPPASAQLVFNEQIYWTTIFVIACVMFRETRQVEKYMGLLCILAIPTIIVVLLETRVQHILWAEHIPAILRVPDPSVQVTLTPSFRAYINVYRAKGTFMTPLSLAEYLSLLTPFFLHFGFMSPKLLTKIASLATIPLLFVAIRMTDARLGVVGMLVSILLYGLIWSIVRWRSSARDLLAAATVYAYPVIFAAGIGVVFASQRMHNMVFGGGAQASSTDARKDQLGMALAKLWQAPWGHGTGQSGEAMGFSEGSFITVDNYFITIALDYGLLGLIFWYGMFITAIVEATRYSISARYAAQREARLLAPLAVALSAFLIIKWVHGQDDNHAIMFMMLGMVSALIYTLRRRTAETAGLGAS